MANTLAYCSMELSRVVKCFVMQTPRDQTSRKYTLVRKGLPSKVASLGVQTLNGVYFSKQGRDIIIWTDIEQDRKGERA
jgi:hypothetical protein